MNDLQDQSTMLRNWVLAGTVGPTGNWGGVAWFNGSPTRPVPTVEISMKAERNRKCVDSGPSSNSLNYMK